MLEILIEYGNILRNVGAFLDTVVFGLINNAYDLIYACASAVFFTSDEIRKIMNSIYVIVGIFALFKVALLLVNSIINPDKLFEKGSGIGNVLVNVLIMFVILVATPIVFQEAYELQRIVVEGHYVEKIFINTDTLNNSQRTPGDAMKDIIISSLIPLDENIKNDNYDCGSAGKEAINEYLEMEVAGFEMYKIAKYASVTCKTKGDNEGNNEGEKFYVYDYNWPITLIAAGFLTYILFSFAIDIAVRSVELAALQLLAPLFIATYVDPKSAKSGPFNKWLTTVGKTFASLFIKIGIISIMLLLFSLIDDVLDKLELPDSVSGWGKILLLIGVLIFAKKAPKWIGDMLGVEGGVGELGIGKKLAGAALVGGALTKGINALGGAAGGLASGAHNQLKNRRAQRKQIRDKEGLNSGAGKKARQARQDFYDKNGLSNAKYSDKVKALRDARSKAYAKENAGWNKDGNLAGLKQMGAAAGAGILLGGKAGIKSDGLKGSFKGGITAGNEFGQRVGMQGESIKDRIATGQDSLIKIAEGTFGSPAERNKQIEEMKKAKKYDNFINDKAFKYANSHSNIPVGQGKFNESFLGAKGGLDAIYAAMGTMASNPDLAGGTFRTNAKGEIEIKVGDEVKATIKQENITSDMVKKGENLFSTEGLMNYQNMYAQAQQQAINSVMTNNAQMGALMQQKSSAEQSMDYNKAEAARLVTAAGLVKDGQISIGNGVSINLSDATIEQMSTVVGAAAGSGKFPKAAMDSLEQNLNILKDSFEKSQNIAENTNEQIQSYQASNAKLSPMIEDIRKEKGSDKTLEALLAIIDKDVSDTKANVDSFNAKKDDK